MYQKYYKKITAYFSKHVKYNSVVHAIGGIGIGFLLALPLAFPHPVRWGLALLVISLLGHLYAAIAKK